MAFTTRAKLRKGTCLATLSCGTWCANRANEQLGALAGLRTAFRHCVIIFRVQPIARAPTWHVCTCAPPLGTHCASACLQGQCLTCNSRDLRVVRREADESKPMTHARLSAAAPRCFSCPAQAPKIQNTWLHFLARLHGSTHFMGTALFRATCKALLN